MASDHAKAVNRRANPAVRLWLWYLSLSEGQRFLLVAATAFLAIFARRPERLLRPDFYGEDGQVFYIGTYFGNPFEVVFRSYAGYEHVVTRLLAYVERAVPVVLAPLVANLGAILIVAFLAAFLASGRLRTVVPHAGMRLALAALLVCLPNSAQTLGNAADLMRYVPVYLLALSLSTVPSSGTARIADAAIAAGAALTGPSALLMLPLFVHRAWRRRERHLIFVTTVLLLGSAVQVVALMVSHRTPANLAAPVDLIRAFAFRSTVQALLGEQVTSVMASSGFSLVAGAALTVVLCVALLWVWHRAIPRAARWPMAYTFVVFFLASALAQAEGGHILLIVGMGERYFVLSTALVGVIAIAGFLRLRRGWARVVSTAIVVLLALGIGGDLRMFPFPTYNWPEAASCIGRPTPCDVEVFPAPQWTIHWPGSSGKYLQPGPHG